MALQVKALATIPDDMGSIPGAYMLEAINEPVALFPPHRLWHASPQTHNFIF